MRTILIIVTLGFLTGCSHQQGVRVNTTRPLSDDEARIIEIARQSLIGGGRRVEFELPRKRAEGGWSVVAWRLPKKPCGTWSILIDENDRVIPSGR